MQLIRDTRIDDFKSLAADMGQPSYRADQLRRWLYADRAHDWADMTNLPASWRKKLSEAYALSGLKVADCQISNDGTRKLLFELGDGRFIESVIIPMETHLTFCISSQVGCAMGCTFCKTAGGGLERNLTPGEIIEQVLMLSEEKEAQPIPLESGREFNIVFMGMGEPLANFRHVATAIETLCDPRGLGISTRRITLSTAGFGPGMRKLLDSDLKVGLTLSLNTTRDMDRLKIMPVPGRTPISEALDLASKYAETRNRTVTIAYVLIAGLNDNAEEARRLAALIQKRNMKVNLIPLNGIGDRQLSPGGEVLREFQSILTAKGIRSYIRQSNGRDIDAACGQLRSRHMDDREPSS